MINLKHVFLGGLTGVFLTVSGSFAMAPETPETTRLRQDLIQEILTTRHVDGVRFKRLIRLENKDTAQQEDLLASMLDTPENKRQYHFPALHTSQFISQKVRTHPDIIAYKGVVPTDLPPALTQWAKVYLKDLSPDFYPILDPDLWRLNIGDIPQKNRVHLTNHLNQGLRPFLPVTAYYRLPAELQKEYYHTTLKQADIARLPNVVLGLKNIYDSAPQPIELMHSLTALTILQRQSAAMMTNPFQTRFEQLIQLGYQQKLDALARAVGAKNALDLAQKTDLILKAWRLNHLSVSTALSLKKHQPLIQKSTASPIAADMKTMAELFQASPGDAKAVAGDLDSIYTLFKSPLFQGLDIYIPLDLTY